MLRCFHLIPERDGQTDGRTNRQADRIAISTSCVSMLLIYIEMAESKVQSTIFVSCQPPMVNNFDPLG